MKPQIGRRALFSAAAVLLAVLCFLSLFLPLPREVGARRETLFPVLWADGTHTQERYGTLLPALSGASAEEIFFTREGIEGVYAGSEGYSDAYRTLEAGTLAPLLALKADLSAIEAAAIFRTFGNRGYFAGEFFAWNGEQVVRTDRTVFSEIFLSAGDWKRGAGRAEKLIVGADAELTGGALTESGFQAIEGRGDYFASDGALYLRTVGVRLVAVLPDVTDLKAVCDYVDKEAFAACGKLKSLDLCGVPAEHIPDGVFAACTQFEFLHTRAAVAGDYGKTLAPCGCFLYTKRK